MPSRWVWAAILCAAAAAPLAFTERVDRVHVLWLLNPVLVGCTWMVGHVRRLEWRLGERTLATWTGVALVGMAVWSILVSLSVPVMALWIEPFLAKLAWRRSVHVLVMVEWLRVLASGLVLVGAAMVFFPLARCVRRGIAASFALEHPPEGEEARFEGRMADPYRV